MTQHTPGQANTPLAELVQGITDGAYGGKIARLDIEYDDGSHSLVPARVAQEAARLIAAAPDLLHLAERVAEGNFNQAGVIAEARAAIAKAKGE